MRRVASRAMAALVVGLVLAAPASAGPERLWLVQSAGPTAEGNAGAMQMQEELVNQLKRIGVDYPEGQFMTLDQIDRLNALFSLNEGEASTRDQAKVILGM